MEQTRRANVTPVGQPAVEGRRRPTRSLPVWRVGVAGGVVGILCCVGPTALALLGVVGAGTAFVWATALYDGFAWWFRLAGLALMAVLVFVALRRRGQCSLRGAATVRGKLVAMLVIAVGTYAALYGVTTWLGTSATA